MMELDLDHLRGWIGHEDQNSEMLTQTSVDRFNATFNRPSSRDEAAHLPLLLHFCLAQPIVPTAELGTDGHPARGGFLPPVPLPRRMWAAGAIDFLAPLRIGEIVTRRSVVEDVTVKHGRTGTLCFVTVRHNIESDGRPVLTERQDIVYRDAAAPGTTARSMEKAPVGMRSAQVAATAPFLFRYSALTFNSHRIHYDAPYSSEEEHYPGLVVHGPLQATMLCQYAADWHGAAPKSFRFRSLAPVFGPGTFTVNASSGGNTMTLWTAQDNGPMGMEGTAEW